LGLARRNRGTSPPETLAISLAVQALVAISTFQSAGDVPVDLNYLFHRQQVERSRAESAPSKAARRAHEELAGKYEEQIETQTGSGFSVTTPHLRTSRIPT